MTTRVSRALHFAVAVLLVALAAGIHPREAQAAPILGPNGHEYDIITAEGITWTNARASALAMGSGWDLATITSASENTFALSSLLPTSPAERSHFWLGATDAAVEGSFAWVTSEAFTYTNWWGGEPNNSGDEDFLAYDFRSTSWAWNDAPDNLGAFYVRGYIVERAVPEPSTIALIAMSLLSLFGFGMMRRRTEA